ncbi:MAG: oxidoreductase, partial [Planctomycetes bacterium]|nr:oxidoreductase [Planctomycetota bacterium]
VMAMGAHTGCNTVFGSTPPHNPHPYPWMNSLFQDGVTVAWMFGESFMVDHARRSVLPERLADMLLDPQGPGLDRETYDRLRHFSDAWMTDREIAELPKAWAVGGDGGMGDIGFQNVSKVVLQNRPNVKVLLLDTQVYSNTGGQNSDSGLMPGGVDMNQFGPQSQGKLTEKKGVAESFTAGHGSPFVAQVSMANAAHLYRAMLDALSYRGAAFLQCFTPCMPEHGVGDDAAVLQTQRARDSRVMPEFVFNPSCGERSEESFNLSSNPAQNRDWWETRRADGVRVSYTPAHFALTEARFRRHLKAVSAADAAKMAPLEAVLARVTQHDVTLRRHLQEDHRAHVPDFGCWIAAEREAGAPGAGLEYWALSRQLVLFCVERRRAWRALQSRAGIDNPDYRAQRALLAKVDRGEISLADLRARALELLAAEQPRPPATATPAVAGAPAGRG